MKRLIYVDDESNNLDPIEAMAVINPQLCKKLGLRVAVVQGGEGPIPHIHVYRGSTTDPKQCSYVRLDTGQYSDHHNKPGLKFSKKEKEAFIAIMESICPKQYHECADGTMRKATGYEAAVDTWVDTYEDGDYSKFTLNTQGDPVMPDFSEL